MVCLSFFFILFFLFFSFGDIRLGWLYCFVCVEKKFLLQLGVFNTRTIVEFFFFGGGEVCYYFLHSLGLEDSKV